MSTTINPETATVTETKPARKWVSKLLDYPVPEGTKLSTTPADFDHEQKRNRSCSCACCPRETRGVFTKPP